MITIEKRYHFYAAHRNKNAGEKCGRIHGHTYNVVCYFRFQELKNGVSMLFSDIDARVEPVIKELDHLFLLYEQDPLCPVLRGEGEQFLELPFETSAENLAIWLFGIIKNLKLPIYRIELAETKTSNVIYEPTVATNQ